MRYLSSVRQGALSPWALLALVVSLVVAGGYSSQADAHRVIEQQRIQSSGLLTLQLGERVRIGLLLPAVQSAVEETQLVVKDTRGETMFNLGVVLEKMGSSFFDIIYLQDEKSGPVMVLRTMDGQEFFASNVDGILVALLLPAVQSVSGAGPRANFQLFDREGNTTGVDSFFDVFTEI